MSFYVYGIGALGLLAVALVAGPGQLVSMGGDAGVWAVLLVVALAQTIGGRGLCVGVEVSGGGDR